jgi:hypothetical protein
VTFETALAGRLLDAPDVVARVGTRVDWEVRVQGAPVPAITLETVTDMRPQTFRGLQRARWTRVQINVWAGSKKDATEIRELVIATLLPATNVGGVQFQRAQDVAVLPRPERTPTEQIYREIIDLTLWHDG